MKKRTLFLLLTTAVLLFGACRNRTAERQEHANLADARAALLKKIITTQERHDSVRRAIIANDTTEFKILTHFIYASRHRERNRYDEAEAEYRYIMKYGDKEESHEAQESLSRMYYGRGMYRESLALLPDSLSTEGVSMEAAAVRELMDQLDSILPLSGCNRHSERQTAGTPVFSEHISLETDPENTVHVFFHGVPNGYAVDFLISLPEDSSGTDVQDWHGKEATIHCKGNGREFSVLVYPFEYRLLGYNATTLLDKDTRWIGLNYPVQTVYRYVLEEPFYFLDVDFDGELEFLVTGRYGREAKYDIYEMTPDGVKLKDYGPFARFNCFTKIDPKSRTIRLFELLGGGHYTTAQFSREEVFFTGQETVPTQKARSSAEAILRDYYKGIRSDFRLDWIRTYDPDKNEETLNWSPASGN